MEKVTAILNRKGPGYRFISSNSSVDEALCRMSCENADHLLVFDNDQQFVGVITEHDILQKAMEGEFYPANIPVEKLVNKRLPTASTDDTVDQCMQRMLQYHVRLLPVFDGFVFKGLVSSDDILDELALNKEIVFDEDKINRVY
jgi:predicted transcriptional regulator